MCSSDLDGQLHREEEREEEVHLLEIVRESSRGTVLSGKAVDEL